MKFKVFSIVISFTMYFGILFAQSPSLDIGSASIEVTSSNETSNPYTCLVKVDQLLGASDLDMIGLVVISAQNDTLVSRRFDAQRSYSRSLAGGFYLLKYHTNVLPSSTTIYVYALNRGGQQGDFYQISVE